jgi:hypothetical protein
MLVAKMDLNGNITESKTFDQNSLTSDCWLVQFDGLVACKSCEAFGTDDCGGGDTLRKLNNEGY